MDARAGQDFTVNPGDTVFLDGSGSVGPDRTRLQYAWQSPPGVTLTGSDTPKPSFVAHDVSEDTTFEFTLTVTDATANLTDTAKVTITINARPTALAGDDQTVLERMTVTLNGSGSDPGDVPIQYSWTQTEGTPVTLNNVDTNAPTFVAPATDKDIVFGFTLTVTDALGLRAADTVSVTVRSDTFQSVSISDDGRRAL